MDTLADGSAITEISLDRGCYIIVLYQGGTRLTGGLAYADIASSYEGSNITKVAGGANFMSDVITFSISSANKVSLNNKDAGGVYVNVYAFTVDI